MLKNKPVISHCPSIVFRNILPWNFFLRDARLCNDCDILVVARRSGEGMREEGGDLPELNFFTNIFLSWETSKKTLYFCIWTR